MNLKQFLSAFDGGGGGGKGGGGFRNAIIPLLLNLIGGCDKLFEFVFQEKITSLAYLLGSGLNCIFH